MIKTGLTIFLILLPLWLIGCDDGDIIAPDDKWPVLLNCTQTSNLDVNLTIVEGYGIPQLKVNNRTIAFTVDVRSYHVSQEWQVYLFLEGVTQKLTVYTDNLPGQQVKGTLPITEAVYYDHVIGTYLGGTPPGGTIQLSLTFDPGWFPTAVPDWINYEIDPEVGLIIYSVTDSYTYNFRVVVEDLDGRTDSKTFSAVSTLNIEN